MKSTCPVFSWAMPGEGTSASLTVVMLFFLKSALSSRYGDPDGTAPQVLPATSCSFVMPAVFFETMDDGLVWYTTPIDFTGSPWARAAVIDTASVRPNSCEPLPTSCAVAPDPVPGVIVTESPHRDQ